MSYNWSKNHVERQKSHPRKPAFIAYPQHPVPKRARVYHVTWYIGDNQYFSIYSYQIAAEHFLQGSTLLSTGTEQ